MTDKLQLEIPLLLPEIPDSADACVSRLIEDLTFHNGVEHAHVTLATGQSEPTLCIHFDPLLISVTKVEEIARRAGARLTQRYAHLIWQIDGISHQRRARSISETLKKMPGVIEAEATVSGPLRIELDRTVGSEEEIRVALDRLNVRILDERQKSVSGSRPCRGSGKGEQEASNRASHSQAHDEKDHSHDHAHGGSGEQTELIYSLACGALLGVGFVLETLVPTSSLALTFYIGSYFFGGFFTLREAIDNIRARRFEIDTLMLVAAAGAAALGEWAEGALLLFLFSLGHALEHYAMGRAKRAIEALADLAPRIASVRRDEMTMEIPVEDLVIGDIVIVRPNSRLPADGFLVKGETSINQAPVTGESMPVDKRPVSNLTKARSNPDAIDAAHRAFAGTINGSGAIEIEVTRTSADSTLAKVVKMVSEAETQKSPTQRLTDKFERIFVPAVLTLAVLLLFAGFVVDEPFRDTFYRAMAVLVAASPCALAIATPSAVLSGVARAARGGVLVKGGAPLENLGSLSAIAFDKTGTLTEGAPRITDLIPAPGVSEEELLAVAVAVERLSDHPLAKAIAENGQERLGAESIPEAHGLRSLTGLGVSARLGDETVLIGKAEMFGSNGVAPLSAEMDTAVSDLRERGRTSMVVRRGNGDLGAIGLMDTPRQSARIALGKLHQLGMKRLIMISGDHQKVAEAVGREVGIDEAWGDLMPEDKVTAVKKLKAEGKVAMVGDGVNDAPAMATATVGIAMGAAGSDVALETADVALMADDLSHLPFAVGLSRSTRSIILQNVIVSLGVVALLVPATILGLSMGAAVAMHEGSTLLVVINALRLLAYKEPV
jgi:Cd2+/Zn2+-exporting ATPase